MIVFNEKENSMVTHYIYGRGKDGYISYNPDYTKTDEEQYFLKMSNYSLSDAGDNERNVFKIPEKMFLFHILTKEKKKCTIFGKASGIPGGSSSLSGSRDTVFSFQYLLSGEERQRILKNPDSLTLYRNFPENMDWVCRTDDVVRSSWGRELVFDVQKFYKNEKNLWNDGRIYSIQELLDAFGVNQNKLEAFIYTFFSFNSKKKVYLMLPDNTKTSTDMAFSLMCKILSVFPEEIVRRTGFITYVNRIETAEADFVPYEIRYLFLANTERNKMACSRTRLAYVFGNSGSTEIEIPDTVRELVKLVVNNLLYDEKNDRINRLWGTLKKYLREDANIPVSDAEYRALDFLCESYNKMERKEANLDAKEVWNNISLLRKMVNKRSDLWKPIFKDDVRIYVDNVITYDCVEETDGYKRILAEYEAEETFRKPIEEFFCRQVAEDYEKFEFYLQIAKDLPELKKKIYGSFIDALREELQIGTLSDSMYEIVLEFYEEHPELQKEIQNFFINKIVDIESYENFYQLLTTSTSQYDANNDLWKYVNSGVYKKQEKSEFLIDMEIKKIEKIISESSLVWEKRMSKLWDSMRKIRNLNKNLVESWDLFYGVRPELQKLENIDTIPESVNNILEEAKIQIESLFSARKQEYMDVFSKLSLCYLKKNQSAINERNDELEVFKNWSFNDEKNRSILEEIINSLQKKASEKENLNQFEKIIKEGQIHRIYKCISKENKDSHVNFMKIMENEKLPDCIKQIFDKMNDESMSKSSLPDVENYFDKIALCLLRKCHEQNSLIISSIMENHYGGVTALHDIYSAWKKDESDENELEKMKECMNNEIQKFFRNYKKSRGDRKSIKAEKDFLKEIGLDYKIILRL